MRMRKAPRAVVIRSHDTIASNCVKMKVIFGLTILLVIEFANAAECHGKVVRSLCFNDTLNLYVCVA